MITSKPVGTISYNTESFLISVLDRLVKSRIVCNYWYILHHGENGDKNHYHVRLELAKRYDTSCIRDMFDEPDPTSDKPLGCMPFVYSDLSHWIMYVLHDDKYLRNHDSQTNDGKIPYDLESIHTMYPQLLQRDFMSACSLRETVNQKIVQSLLDNGNQPLPVLYSVASARPHDIMLIRNMIDIYNNYNN